MIARLLQVECIISHSIMILQNTFRITVSGDKPEHPLTYF
jgi:hypothetical protein